MDQEQSIKIRALPRSGEDKGKPSSPVKDAPPAPRRMIIYIGTLAIAALMGLVVNNRPTKRESKALHSKDLSSVRAGSNDKVTKYLQEAQLKSEMLAQTRQIENMNVKKEDLDVEPYALDQTRVYGVQLDQEDTAAKIYEDLHDDFQSVADLSPSDKINARLANRRWTNELERNERVTFVREFIRSAYDKGYEVQLDQNLVVVGVKKINANQKVSIDQVLNKLAKQGL